MNCTLAKFAQLTATCPYTGAASFLVPSQSKVGDTYWGQVMASSWLRDLQSAQRAFESKYNVELCECGKGSFGPVGVLRARVEVE